MSLLETLGLRRPFIQAPMAGISTPELAAAVCEVGGLGSIALGALGPAQALEVIANTRALTRQPLAINFFCHRPARRNAEVEAQWVERLRPEFGRFGAAPPPTLTEIYPSFRGNAKMMKLAIDARPAVVSFHFGLPDRAEIEQLRSSGAMLLATATNLAEARAIKAAGLDAIVAQGWEAGGHRGMFDPAQPDERLPTLALLRQLAEIGLPLVAAGGIMTQDDARAAFQAGAVAVQAGSAFLLAPEAATSPQHRAMLASADTMMTRAISGRPARGLKNAFDRFDETAAPDYPVAYDAAKALHAAAQQRGSSEFGAYWAGGKAHMAVARSAAQTVQAICP